MSSANSSTCHAIHGNSEACNRHLHAQTHLPLPLLLMPLNSHTQVLVDGVRFTPAAMRAIGIVDTTAVIKHTLLAALCFHSYQQVGRQCCCTCAWMFWMFQA